MKMQSTVQNIREGLWNLPSTVNSMLLAGTATHLVDKSSNPDRLNISTTKRSPERDDNNNDDATDEDEEEESESYHDDDTAPNKPRAHSVSTGEASVSEQMNSSVSSLYDEKSDRNPPEVENSTIPYALVREQWQLVLLDPEASLTEVSQAIDSCQKLVQSSAYGIETDEHKWLVRYLIELRYRRRELLDFDRDPEATLEETKVIMGHHFVKRKHFPAQPQQKQHLYCDHCSGIIWNVVQASYVCNDCSFAVHHKCVRNVIRICAHVVTTEHNLPIECICPEIGLAFQKYTCAECGTQLSYNISTAVNCFGLEFKAEKLNSIEPRLCDYTGLYYCPACHWNDTSIIPARITNNWDFVPRKVCRASHQQIGLLLTKPVIRLEEKNPRLFSFIPQLAEVKRVRVHLGVMKRYLTACRLAEQAKLIVKQIGKRRHLMQTVALYSVADLVGVEDGSLLGYLRSVRATFEHHIRNCLICSGKAYICELCNNDEILFPFDEDIFCCTHCSAVSHRGCYLRKNMKCAKCSRLRKRALHTLKEQLDLENGN
ncbi:differentially expressed in FDCP 8 homolog [Anopheles coustani]|uniref:differentially expressed in FDCP 8 homolog n=2 Tax=coustani group TaxID=59130 RepID=UPI00265AA576|nr:differentially expressed in FDCP 8 homolog [Anopheles coustani]